MIQAIEKLMVHDTAGDPMTALRWTRKATGKISHELAAAGIDVSPSTVARLLKHLGYSLRVNRKQIARSSSEHRDEQFRYIKSLRDGFEEKHLPIVSVDSKKKELVGQFKNPGVAWSKEAIKVNDHDFRSDAKGIAVPYGILDLPANRGHVAVGMSRDTAQFAVRSLVQWWVRQGRRRYPAADHLLILADNGGSNGSRTRAWKHQLQTEFCDRFHISVTVCHYPPGASKWNPIEHKLFSPVSRNWAACPLNSFETILNYIRTTKTRTGLRVTATLDPRAYATGVKITKAEMATVHLEPHATLPEWNYTLRPVIGA